MISDERLLELNIQGFIPGPGETEKAFLQRVQECLRFSSQADETAGQYPAALQKAHALFGMTPVWVPIQFANRGLAPWHGAAATFLHEEGLPSLAWVQLRQRFSRQERLHGYHRDDLLAHELAHVGRMAFQEPRYEELLACQANPVRWRSILGALFQTSFESLLFACILLLIIALDAASLSLGFFALYEHLLWLKLLPVVLIFLGLTRLYRRFSRLSRCRRRLTRILGKKASALLYRLSDVEIDTFASLNPQAIWVYAQARISSSLRWRLLGLAYFTVT